MAGKIADGVEGRLKSGETFTKSGMGWREYEKAQSRRRCRSASYRLDPSRSTSPETLRLLIDTAVEPAVAFAALPFSRASDGGV